MPKIVQYNLPPGGTVVQLADNDASALTVESTTGADFFNIVTTDDAEKVQILVDGTAGIEVAKDATLDVVYVGIGGAADDVNNTLLQLNGDSDEAELAFKLSGGATTTMGYRGQAVFSIDTNGGFQVRNHGGSLRFQIDASGNIQLKNLPTSDPGVDTQLWNDSGAVKISAG